MKAFLWLALLTTAAGALFTASGQVTNLKVNGVTSSFSMTSGDTVRWTYDLPVGATAFGELWYDVNGNGAIDPGTDVARFLFTQTDGDTNGNGGPPDLDGLVNGHVLFYQRVGLSPGKYVFRVTENSVGQSVAGTILALSSPAHTISGTVTPPAGKSAQYINVVVNRSGQFGDPNFWDAFTNVSGNYSIQMTADTAGNPWSVRIEVNPYPPAAISPQDSLITITGNHSGYNFTMVAAAAQVDGTIKDESGTPLTNNNVNLNRNDGGVYRNGNPDVTGTFRIGLLMADLAAQTWRLQSNNNGGGNTGSKLVAQRQLPVISQGDSLYYSMVVYNANSTISGQVRINGTPANFPVQLEASSPDSAYAGNYSDSTSGNYVLQVTNKIHNYNMFPVNLPPNYNASPVTAHPGDAGVIISITVTSVKERGTGIPGVFALYQNYPNPFNPATAINYDLPAASHVRLAVFNILGEEVDRLVDAEQGAGTYRATLDASRFSSGVYIYRLTAISSTGARPSAYSVSKKMLLMR
ncbi:MAG TPA: T9SS type A sorting domain-containing protein [Bacteroidota bacterium]|nr:T9SS type A sorting domain-containing protein [Bacteroidota bacterium]